MEAPFNSHASRPGRSSPAVLLDRGQRALIVSALGNTSFGALALWSGLHDINAGRDEVQVLIALAFATLILSAACLQALFAFLGHTPLLRSTERGR